MGYLAFSSPSAPQGLLSVQFLLSVLFLFPLDSAASRGGPSIVSKKPNDPLHGVTVRAIMRPSAMFLRMMYNLESERRKVERRAKLSAKMIEDRKQYNRKQSIKHGSKSTSRT